MLQFKSVSCVYGDGTRAIDDVSLQIRTGEFCVLLGPSGAGKSTLMNMVNGLVDPSSGSINLGDITLSKKNITQIQRKIGMIHQQLYLVPRLTVLHNVLTGLLPETGLWRSLFKSFTPADQRRAFELLHKVGLEEKHLLRRASNLSGGQQQRVAIARALISMPEVLIADEPVASLDPAMSRSVLEDLKTTAKDQGATVICTLHQLEYALEFADRIIAIQNGKIFFDGHPNKLDEKKQTRLYNLTHAQDAETVLAA